MRDKTEAYLSRPRFTYYVTLPDQTTLGELMGGRSNGYRRETWPVNGPIGEI